MRIAAVLIAMLTLAASGLGIYARHLQGEVQEQRDLVASKDETITGLRNDVAERDQNIAALRGSRDLVNTRLATLIAENNARVDAEVERRKRIAAERDSSREALRIALDAIATESERDETFAAWLAQSSPAAAWDRLRAAAE